MNLFTSLLVAAASLSVGLSGVVYAQADAKFPTKPVTLVVPFTANSGSDIIARLAGPKLSAKWAQTVIVDNKPGASGTIGANAVARAAPDGHTILMMINSFVMTPAMYKNMPYDPAADFISVTKLAEANFAFAVHPAVPAKDMKSLFDYIKKNSGKVNYASPGNGTPHHLAMELLKSKYNLNVSHVPYKGISGALTDLMGGQVELMFGTVHSMRPYAESGKVRLLAVTGQGRNPLAPNIATFHEQGIDVMDSVDAWYGVMVPAKTPAPIVAQLHADFTAVMGSDEIKAELAKVGIAVQTGSPAQMSNQVKTDLARWRKVITDAGITAD